MKLIVVPSSPSAALNWTDVSLMLKTSVLPGPVSPLMVTVPPLPVNASVSPPGIVPTGLPPRVTLRLVLPLLGVTAYWLPAVLSNPKSLASPAKLTFVFVRVEGAPARHQIPVVSLVNALLVIVAGCRSRSTGRPNSR